MSEFVDTPQCDEFVKTPAGYKGGSGTYDGDDHGPFGEYKRTSSSNGVPEKLYDGAIPKPSGESDHF